MMTHTRFNLADQEAATQKALADAQQIKTDLLVELANGSDVQSALSAIREEIEAHEMKLATFKQAREVAAQKNTTAARTAAHEATLERLANAVVAAEQVTEAATEVVLMLAELRAALDAVETARSNVHRALLDTARDSQHGAPSERAASEIQDTIRKAVNALTLPTAYLSALVESGIGKNGIRLDADYVSIRRPAVYTNIGDTSADAEAALVKVRSLAEKIASWSESANGVKAA